MRYSSEDGEGEQTLLQCEAAKWIWLQIVMGDLFTLRQEIHNGRWPLEHILRGSEEIFLKVLRVWRVEVPNLSKMFFFFSRSQ